MISDTAVPSSTRQLYSKRPNRLSQVVDVINADLELKVAAQRCGMCYTRFVAAVSALGYRRMYVTAEERAHLLARRGKR